MQGGRKWRKYVEKQRQDEQLITRYSLEREILLDSVLLGSKAATVENTFLTL
jgi:hypothetical protein